MPATRCLEHIAALVAMLATEGCSEGADARANHDAAGVGGGASTVAGGGTGGPAGGGAGGSGAGDGGSVNLPSPIPDARSIDWSHAGIPGGIPGATWPISETLWRTLHDQGQRIPVPVACSIMAVSMPEPTSPVRPRRPLATWLAAIVTAALAISAITAAQLGGRVHGPASAGPPPPDLPHPETTAEVAPPPPLTGSPVTDVGPAESAPAGSTPPLRRATTLLSPHPRLGQPGRRRSRAARIASRTSMSTIGGSSTSSRSAFSRSSPWMTP